LSRSAFLGLFMRYAVSSYDLKSSSDRSTAARPFWRVVRIGQ